MQAADSHVHIHSPQRETAEIEPCLARAEVDVEVQLDVPAQAHVPLVFGVAESSAVALRLRNPQHPRIILDLGFPGRHVEIEVGAHQLVRAAADPQVAGAHFKVSADDFRIIPVDRARIVLRWRRVVDDDTACHPQQHTENGRAFWIHGAPS